jgi:hypothetical protein
MQQNFFHICDDFPLFILIHGNFKQGMIRFDSAYRYILFWDLKEPIWIIVLACVYITQDVI